MSEHPLKKKTSLVMFGLLVAGATASNLRYTQTGAYADPYCNTWSADGSCCLKCAHRYFMNAHGRCQAVSDWCKTWDDKTGCCTSCFDGYGVPHNGVCSSIPVDDCSDEVSYERPSDCESGEDGQVKRWRSKYGSKNKRNHSKKSRNSRKSKHSKDCSEEKVTESCEQSYSGAENHEKWGKVDHWGYRHNGKFGHKVAGKFAEKWSQRQERESRWFSKKSKHEGKSKVKVCEQESTKEHREPSCSKKSVRSLSKSVRSLSKSVRALSKSIRSLNKSIRSLSKNVGSLIKKSHHSKKECKSLSKKSHRSVSKKSHHSKKECESPSKKSHRSLSKKSDCSRKSKHSERKSKRSERKSRFEGLSKRRVEMKSKHECGSKKCCEVKEHCSVKKECCQGKSKKC